MTTNHQLEIMIVKLHEKVDTVLTQQEKSAEWQEAHEQNDEKRFKEISQFGTAITIVAAGIGYYWNKIIGKSS